MFEIQHLITKGTLQFVQKEFDVQNNEDEVDVVTIPVTSRRIHVTIPVPTKKPPVIITLPRPVHYTSEKAIPWNYGSEYYRDGKKLNVKTFEEGKSDERKIEGNEPVVLDIAEESRITRSGRIFSPPNLVEKSPEALAKAKAKGKGVMIGGESTPKI